MEFTTPTIAAQTRDRLGESPLWHPAEQAIYWTDLFGPTLHRMRLGGTVESWTVPGTKCIGSFVFATRGRLLLAIDTGLMLFDPATGTFTPFADPNEGREGVIYNDSKVDRFGRLWVGTLDLAEVEPRGLLYCVDPNGRATVGDGGFPVCNGPAFSPDGSVLYFSDSVGRRILAYDLSPESGRLRNRREFAKIAEADGVPDGLTVDAEGGIWCAHYGGGRLTRFAPDGAILAVIELPCPIVTSMGFGGARMDTLFVTTGWTTAAKPQEGEPGGELYKLETTITGLHEPYFDVA